MDVIRKEMGDRVYFSAIVWGLAVGGLVVLLVVKAAIYGL